MKNNWANNYYLLINLLESINDRLAGSVLVEVYQHNPREFVFQFGLNDDHLSLTFFAYGKESFVFTGKKDKPRHGAPLLFRELTGKEVKNTGVFQNDRSFYLQFDEDHRLVFKLYGRHANVIHFHGEEPVSMLRKKLRKDREKLFSEYHRPIEQTFENFQQKLREGDSAKSALKKLFPVWPEDVFDYLDNKEIEKEPEQQQWEMAEKLDSYFRVPKYYISRKPPDAKNDPGIFLTVFEVHDVVNKTNNVEEAVTGFAKLYLKNFNQLLIRNALLDHFRKQEKQLLQKTENSKQRIARLQSSHNYKSLADIIMANLHQLEKGTENARLYDFYNDSYVDIPMKSSLSPQKNAERYYRKGRNQSYELEKAEEQLNENLKKLEEVRSKLREAENEENRKQLQKWYNELFEKSSKAGKEEASATQFREFSYKGYRIYVGKSAQSNDKLTFGFANKNDLWLHARDRQGSHVIVRNPGVENFPSEVIERAAAIAAYYSKGKGESLCPVAYTRKKYVWKPKGANPGAAMLKNEKVLMVEPAI